MNEIQNMYELVAERVEPGTLGLLSLAGSRAYGTGNDGSDWDYKGVYMASPRQLASLRPPHQSLAGQVHPHQPCDADVTVYELAHFAKLAAAANPTVLETLWSPEMEMGPWGPYLVARRSLFLSKRVVQTYGGYAVAQLKKAAAGTGGSRGATHHKRVKFRLHTLRLLDSGMHVLRYGEVPVRLPEHQATNLRALAESMMDLEALAKARLRALDDMAERSSLPDTPDVETLDKMLWELRRSVVPA